VINDNTQNMQEGTHGASSLTRSAKVYSQLDKTCS